MLGLDSTTLVFIALAGCSAGAIAYAFLFSRITTEKNVGKRLESVKKAETDRAVAKASRSSADSARTRASWSGTSARIMAIAARRALASR